MTSTSTAIQISSCRKFLLVINYLGCKLPSRNFVITLPYFTLDTGSLSTSCTQEPRKRDAYISIAMGKPIPLKSSPGVYRDDPDRDDAASTSPALLMDDVES